MARRRPGTAASATAGSCVIDPQTAVRPPSIASSDAVHEARLVRREIEHEVADVGGLAVADRAAGRARAPRCRDADSCGWRVIERTIGVSMPPGWIELQRIASPFSRQCAATDLVRMPHGALARAVGRERRRAHEARGRRDVDDRAAAAAPHRRDRVLAAQEHALGVHGHDLAPLLDRGGLDVGHDDDARVVHEHVEPAEARERRLDHLAPALLVAHVVAHEDRVAADRLGRLAAERLVHVGEHDARALAREHLRAAAPDARRGARHDRHLVFDASRHDLPPTRRARSVSPTSSSDTVQSRRAAAASRAYAS